MKTNRFCIFCSLCLAVLSLSGCDSGFFDNGAPSAVTPQNVFSSVTLTEQSIAAVYELFGEDRSYRNRLACGYAGVNTDIEYNRKSSNEYAIYQTRTTNTDLSNAKGSDPWGYLNAMIERCNNVVDGVDRYGFTEGSPADSSVFAYLQGEALFLRSFALLEMVKLWGDVPVNVSAYDGTSVDAAAHRKVDRNIAFEQIRRDLTRAAELMPWSADIPLASARNDVRRPSRAAALALLARADLMYAGKAVRPVELVPGCRDYTIRFNLEDPAKRQELYREVLAACDTIIRQEHFKLQSDYAKVFRDVCADRVDYASMEQIWVIPFADGARGQVMNYNCAKFNSNSTSSSGDYTMGILLHNVRYSESVSSNFIMSMVPTLLFDYEPGDLRRDVTVLPYKWNTTTSGTIDNSLTRSEKSKLCLYPMVQQDASQWACGKYRIEWMSRDNVGTDDGIDFPVLRYSDVLLMYAEAGIGSLDATAVTPSEPTLLTPQEAFDAVRARAGVASRPLTLENIREERKLEFAGEYIRKYDLMRWGILKETLVDAHARIEELRENFEGHNICFHYREDNSCLQPGAMDINGKNPVTRGYVVDEIYGARLNENQAKKGDFWLTKACKFSEKLDPATYVLYDYDDPESINSHQYWPIFSTVVGASNGLLFNNYGY